MGDFLRGLPKGFVIALGAAYVAALIVYAARVAKSTAAPTGTRWVRVDDLGNEALPNVMRKVVFHALKKQRA